MFTITRNHCLLLFFPVALACYACDSGVDCVHQDIEKLSSLNRDEKLKIVARLGSTQPESKYLLPCIQKLCDDDDVIVQIETIKVIGTFGNKGSSFVPLLLRMMEKPSSKTKIEAITAIRELKAEVSVWKALLDMAVANDELVRLTAIQVIGTAVIKPDCPSKAKDDAVPVLTQLLIKDQNEEVRYNALAALANIGGPGRASIQLATKDKSPNVQSYAKKLLMD